MNKNYNMNEKSYLKTVREALMTILMLLMILVSLYVERNSYYNEYFHKYILFELSCVIIIALLILISRKITEIHEIDRLAIVFWAGFAIYTLVSDILVDKQYRFAETGVFFSVLVLGYAINNTNDHACYINAFKRSAKFFLLILLALSILFPSPVHIEGRFSGPIENPSVYALYLCAIWSVLIGCIETQIRNKERISLIIVSIVELITALTLILLSDSITPLIALIIVTGLWIFRLLLWKLGKKRAIKLSITVGIVLLIVFMLLVFFIRNANLGEGSRLIQKVQSSDISTFLSGRDHYWRRYLREMNLLGHGKKPFLWYHRILPHNALIGMMYWYGVPCVVPYIIVMMMAIEKSYRFADTSIPYAAVPFYSIVSFVIMSMADNVEQPFVWLPWIACYLMMAPILIMPVEKIEALKTADKSVCAKEID